MSSTDILKLLEYLKENHSSPRLNTMIFYILIGVAIVSFLYFLLNMLVYFHQTLKPYIDKEVQIEVINGKDHIKLSSKFELRLDEYICEHKSNTENVFLCTVPPREHYNCSLKYDGDQIKEEIIQKNDEYHKLYIDKTPLLIKDCEYKIEKDETITGTFKLFNALKGSVARPFQDLKIRLCDGPLINFQDNGGIINFNIPWKQLNHYYYESCKEGLEFTLEHDSLIPMENQAIKHFFFIGDTSFFDMGDQKNIEIDKKQITFMGRIKQNDFTILKNNDKEFLLKLKAKYLTPNTALTFQIDNLAIKIEGEHIAFNDDIRMLEQTISNDGIVEVEVKRTFQNIQITLFQNGQKISGTNNTMILTSNKIEKLKIGYYYSGEPKNIAVLSIFDVSIQRWIPIGL